MKINVVKMKALVKNIKRERPLAVCGGNKGSWVCDEWKMIILR